MERNFHNLEKTLLPQSHTASLSCFTLCLFRLTSIVARLVIHCMSLFHYCDQIKVKAYFKRVGEP